MGFLKDMFGGAAQGGAAPTLTLSRQYLRSVPPGPTGQPSVRKGSLYNACLNQIADLPLASAGAFGAPVADTHGLAPAIEIVRSVMARDAAVYGWVARDGLVVLDVLLENTGPSWNAALDLAMASVGLVAGPALRDPAGLSPEVQERVLGLANCALQMFWVVAQPQQGLRADRAYYDHVFSSRDDRTRETAYDITAWSAVVISRLINSGRAPRLAFMDPALATAPAMTEPGWYPNPYNYGEIIGGEATFQRYWDGSDWTDRIRHDTGGRWNESLHSMHKPPNN